MGKGEMEDDRVMAMEFESMVCIQNLGGRHVEIYEGRYFGLRGDGVGGEIGVFQRMFLVTKVTNIGQAKTH